MPSNNWDPENLTIRYVSLVNEGKKPKVAIASMVGKTSKKQSSSLVKRNLK
jgi:hypothetical protein